MWNPDTEEFEKIEKKEYEEALEKGLQVFAVGEVFSLRDLPMKVRKITKKDLILRPMTKAETVAQESILEQRLEDIRIHHGSEEVGFQEGEFVKTVKDTDAESELGQAIEKLASKAQKEIEKQAEELIKHPPDAAKETALTLNCDCQTSSAYHCAKIKGIKDGSRCPCECHHINMASS